MELASAQLLSPKAFQVTAKPANVREEEKTVGTAKASDKKSRDKGNSKTATQAPPVVSEPAEETPVEAPSPPTKLSAAAKILQERLAKKRELEEKLRAAQAEAAR